MSLYHNIVPSDYALIHVAFCTELKLTLKGGGKCCLGLYSSDLKCEARSVRVGKKFISFCPPTFLNEYGRRTQIPKSCNFIIFRRFTN